MQTDTVPTLFNLHRGKEKQKKKKKRQKGGAFHASPVAIC
jgi:hypothetical protein